MVASVVVVITLFSASFSSPLIVPAKTKTQLEILNLI